MDTSYPESQAVSIGKAEIKEGADDLAVVWEEKVTCTCSLST
jgi:hypothetical protein